MNVSLLYADAAVVMKRTSLELREDLQRAFAGYDPPLVQDYLDAPTLKNASDAYAEKAEAFANASLREVDLLFSSSSNFLVLGSWTGSVASAGAA